MRTLEKILAFIILTPLILTVGFFVLFNLVFFFFEEFSWSEIQFKQKLEKRLNNNEKYIKISELTDFEWNMVCRLNGYRGRTGEELWDLHFYRCDECGNKPLNGTDHISKIFHFDDSEYSSELISENDNYDCAQRNEAVLRNNGGRVLLIGKE